MKHFYGLLIVLLSTCVVEMPLSVASVASEVQKGKKLTLAIFPRLNPIQSNRMYTPLANYLSKQLKVRVELVTPKDFASFWDGVRKQQYDLVHYNQYHYVKSRKEFGYQVILKNIEFKESTIAGALIVRKDSPIKSIKDLKGKTIVFGGGSKAMQSYIVARYLLQRGGLTTKDYNEEFAKNPPNAILSTYYRQSAAAGAGDKVLRLRAVTGQIDTSEMRYLAVGPQLAHLPWAVKSDMADSLKARIQHLMTELAYSTNGRLLLKKMQLDGFAKAVDADYDKHRRIIKSVLEETW